MYLKIRSIKSQMNLEQIKKEIDEIKIKLGIEQSILEKKQRHMKKINIENLATAERFLQKTQIKIKDLIQKKLDIEKKAEQILEDMT